MDPQFHTRDGGVGPWDFGTGAINQYMDSHTCSKYCRYLELDPVKESSPPPKPQRPKPRPRTNLNATPEKTGTEVENPVGKCLILTMKFIN